MKMKAKTAVLLAVASLMLATGMKCGAHAAEPSANIVDNVAYCDEGTFHVTEFGKSVSIAGKEETHIIPNNVSNKIDVMINGQLFKQLDGVIIKKDDKSDSVILSKGSIVIEVPSVLNRDINKIANSVKKGNVTDVLSAKTTGVSLDKNSFAYEIGDQGKIFDENGKDVSKLIKTDCDYKSVEKVASDFSEEMAKAEVKESPKSEDGPKSDKGDDKGSVEVTPRAFEGVYTTKFSLNQDGRTIYLTSDAENKYKYVICAYDDVLLDCTTWNALGEYFESGHEIMSMGELVNVEYTVPDGYDHVYVGIGKINAQK